MSQTKQWIISLTWKELLKIGKKIISNPSEEMVKDINRYFVEKMNKIAFKQHDVSWPSFQIEV